MKSMVRPDFLEILYLTYPMLKPGGDVMEKQLRCKDCKMMVTSFDGFTRWSGCYRKWTVRPGQFACKKFVYKDK